MKKFVLLGLSVLCISSLSIFSSCAPRPAILGTDDCSKFTITGPDKLILQPCDGTPTIRYDLLYNSGDPTDIGYTYSWVVDGDLIAIPPITGKATYLLVQSTAKPGTPGSGSISVLTQDYCPSLKEGQVTLLATTGQIQISTGSIDIDLHLCQDQQGTVLDGSADVIDDEYPLISKDYLWAIAPPDAADLSSTTDPNIKITNIKKDFDLTLQKGGVAYTTVPLLKKVILSQLPTCQ